jgi:NAD(P)-dependent dehydrogenase (short-subunit alcohol dehydrogenase family)
LWLFLFDLTSLGREENKEKSQNGTQRFRHRRTLRRFVKCKQSIAEATPGALWRQHRQAVLFVQTYIGTAAGVQEAISRIQQEWGGLDILVNNVGDQMVRTADYEALSDDDWQKALNVNLLASVRLDRAFLPGMIERRSGVILHISMPAKPLYKAPSL